VAEDFQLLFTIVVCAVIYWAWRRRQRWFCPHGWKVLRTTYTPAESWGRGDRVYQSLPAMNHVLMTCPKCGATKLVRMLGDTL